LFVSVNSGRRIERAGIKAGVWVYDGMRSPPRSWKLWRWTSCREFGRPLAAVCNRLREGVPSLTDDRFVAPDIAHTAQWIRSGVFAAAAGVVGMRSACRSRTCQCNLFRHQPWLWAQSPNGSSETVLVTHRSAASSGEYRLRTRASVPVVPIDYGSRHPQRDQGAVLGARFSSCRGLELRRSSAP